MRTLLRWVVRIVLWVYWQLPSPPLAEALVPSVSVEVRLPWRTREVVAVIDLERVDGGQVARIAKNRAGQPGPPDKIVLYENQFGFQQHGLHLVYGEEGDVVVIKNVEVWHQVPPPEQLVAR